MPKSNVQDTDAGIDPVSERPPVLAVGLGRGNGGKSTGLSEIVWRARNQGRNPIIADGDARSATLASMFPGEAMVPPGDELPTVKGWLNEVILRMLSEQRSAVLDLGGGDRVLQEYGRELELVDFCAENGIEPMAVYFLGAEPEDLRHVASIWESGYFRPKRTVLVLNSGVIKEGKTTVASFERTTKDPAFLKMIAAGAVTVAMKRLPCMDAVRDVGTGFYDAATGSGARPLDPIAMFQTKKWLRDLEQKRIELGAAGWLP